MRAVETPLVAVAAFVLLAAGCSSSGSSPSSSSPKTDGSGSATTSSSGSTSSTTGIPLVTPAPAPASMKPVTVGTVTISVPSDMTVLTNLGDDPDARVVGYRSAPDATGTAGVVLVTLANAATRSAKAEAEALVGAKRDVDHATSVQMTAVSWKGFDGAYAVSYDDRSSVAGKPGLHALVVIAQTTQGPLVNVTAKAPAALFASLDLTASVASLVPSGTPS
jgi:hypothetical protein